MRILFTFVGGNGHFQPLVPIAHAAESAGHMVVFAGSASMNPTVRNHGFASLTLDMLNADRPERIPLRAVSIEREEYDLRELFARRAARTRAADIVSICSDWKPDLIVCDEVDFGAMIAAEYLGIPHASVIVIAAGSFIRPEIVSQPLDEIRADYDLAADPNLAMLSRYLVLSPVPASYRDPKFPLPSTAHLIQPNLSKSQSDSFPIPNHKEGLPTVYFTLGTVFTLESGDLFSRVLTGLRDLPINLIMTVGRDIDPKEFGSQPKNVHIAQYIPQSEILPHCDLVVSHGGSGSVIAALAHGIPMVLIPMGADQPFNAIRCEALGLAQVLDAIEATPEIIGKAASTVLNGAAYRQAAQVIRDEIAAMPEPSHAVVLLEQLAKTNQPVFST